MHESKKNISALSVSEGVPQPGSINQRAVDQRKKAKKRPYTSDELLLEIRRGDISMLGQGITLVESSLESHFLTAQELVAACLPYSGSALRVGITGVPGAGKSTFIESLGKHVLRKGGRLAVLAIDPSSERSRGSILGDKTRMEELAGSHQAYIRPSPTGGTLGGVARKTRETIILCEAAGFDTIFVETVGVGQSETAVHSMVDFFLLVMLAGAGDELQGIKRGIMEMADAIVINKADGNNMGKARRAQAEFANALHLFPPARSGWTPQVKTCSSIYNIGITEIWEMIQEYASLVSKSGFLKERRLEQSRYWMYETLRDGLYKQVFNDPALKKELEIHEKAISEGRTTAFMAASAILNKFKSGNSSF
ncbi:MAG: methylmalonyl Co-A mutase-associated GTPase MeaB [Bacteroidales bacterium]|nr:methylmalonyl Co-A mutase-associated GTPase MeaB [Bacteroidales bacterium]